ncbi:hypothetical protein HK104_000950 [Borealophlyctis nickersoniae]|nr:hypothetical protein HK104_000950 [Borealophlyctis nickersoniae]
MFCRTAGQFLGRRPGAAAAPRRVGEGQDAAAAKSAGAGVDLKFFMKSSGSRIFQSCLYSQRARPNYPPRTPFHSLPPVQFSPGRDPHSSHRYDRPDHRGAIVPAVVATCGWYSAQISFDEEKRRKYWLRVVDRLERLGWKADGAVGSAVEEGPFFEVVVEDVGEFWGMVEAKDDVSINFFLLGAGCWLAGGVVPRPLGGMKPSVAAEMAIAKVPAGFSEIGLSSVVRKRLAIDLAEVRFVDRLAPFQTVMNEVPVNASAALESTPKPEVQAQTAKVPHDAERSTPGDNLPVKVSSTVAEVPVIQTPTQPTSSAPHVPPAAEAQPTPPRHAQPVSTSSTSPSLTIVDQESTSANILALTLLHSPSSKRHHRHHPTPSHLFQAAAEHGHTAASYNAALCFHHGRGGARKDLVRATVLYRQAAYGGHADAMFNLGVILVGDGRVEEGCEWVLKAAGAGCKEAQDVVRTLQKGTVGGGEREGDEWVEDAEKGSTLAAYNAGVVCEAAGDVEGAVKWYEMATRSGDVEIVKDANYNLGLLLLPTNPTLARTHLRRAAELGDDEAKSCLASL